mgnify:CR=1 FL=1
MRKLNRLPGPLAGIISTLFCGALILGLAGTARAETIVIDYEDLAEGSLGDPLLHQGVTYHDLNTVSGVFPNGETFDPQPQDEFILENAGLFYNDFPGYGSPVNALTFGIAFIPGENLTIGALSTVTMDLPAPATSASLDLAYYENGVWGGIVYHLDALHEGQVVASDSFTISDNGGRDNPAASSLEVSGVLFDQLHLYATFGADYSMPRGMIDDLTITFSDGVPTVETRWGRMKESFLR